MFQSRIDTRKIFIVIIITMVVVDIVMAGLVMYFSPMHRIKKLLSLGDKYLLELNYDDAILAYEVAIRIDPKSEDAYIGLARVYIGKEDYDKALEAIERGISEISETDMLISYKEEVEEKLEEVRIKAEKENALWEFEKSNKDRVEQNQEFMDLNMGEALSKPAMNAILKEVVYCMDENDGYGLTFSAKDNDYWRIINIFVVDDAYYREIGMKKPDYDESEGLLSYDEDSIKRIISAIDPDFNGSIDYDLVNRSKSVMYDKNTFSFTIGEKGEVGSVLSGYVDLGNGKGEVYGNLYDWSEEKDFGGYCKVIVVENAYEETEDEPVFPLSVESAVIISEDEYRNSIKKNNFIKINER